MKHHLTYKDDKSDKFWQIEVNGTSFTVTYGKTGTAGTSQTKAFASEEQCKKEAEKLLNEKLKKGYVEGSADTVAGNYLTKWKTLENAESPAKAMEKHFITMGATPKVRKKLRAICSAINTVNIEGDYLKVTLESEAMDEPTYFFMAKPYESQFDESVPVSFRKFFRVHNGFIHTSDEELEEASLEIVGVHDSGKMGRAGNWDSHAVKEGRNEDVLQYLEKSGKTVKDIVCFGTYDESQNWYLLHPFNKNSAGEPAIVEFDHGGCNMKEVSDHTIMDVLIIELANTIETDDEDDDDDE